MQTEPAKFTIGQEVKKGRGRHYVRGSVLEIREPTEACGVRAYRVGREGHPNAERGWFWEHELKSFY